MTNELGESPPMSVHTASPPGRQLTCILQGDPQSVREKNAYTRAPPIFSTFEPKWRPTVRWQSVPNPPPCASCLKCATHNFVVHSHNNALTHPPEHCNAGPATFLVHSWSKEISYFRTKGLRAATCNGEFSTKYGPQGLPFSRHGVWDRCSLIWNGSATKLKVATIQVHWQ